MPEDKASESLQPTDSLAEGSERGETIQICKGQACPAGWVIVNNRVHSDDCSFEGIYENAMIIQNIQGCPHGTRLLVCKGQPCPPGWIIVDNSAHYDGCMFGGIHDNAIVIQKS